MAKIIDNRESHQCLFGELNEGDFFTYGNCLYEVCSIDNPYGDTDIRAVSVDGGQVVVDFYQSDVVQPVEVTITIERNL